MDQIMPHDRYNFQCADRHWICVYIVHVHFWWKHDYCSNVWSQMVWIQIVIVTCDWCCNFQLLRIWCGHDVPLWCDKTAGRQLFRTDRWCGHRWYASRTLLLLCLYRCAQIHIDAAYCWIDVGCGTQMLLIQCFHIRCGNQLSWWRPIEMKIQNKPTIFCLINGKMFLTDW